MSESPRPGDPGAENAVEVLFLGDVCFGASYGRPAAGTDGLDSGFANLTGLLQRADLVIANLETTLTEATVSPLEGMKRYVHRDDPRAAGALRRQGVHAVSLANNHAFDYGTPGLTDTLASLEAAGIAAIGAGLSRKSTDRELVRDLELERSTFRLAVIAGKHDTRRYAYPYFAGKEQAGIVGWRRRSAAAQIRALREAEPDAFLVAFPHWGKNYRWRSRKQRKLAAVLVEAGADLVVGHGSHCLQEIERLDGRWIVYSIGNSVFQTGGRYRSRPKILPYSLIAALRITEAESGRCVSLRLYPILSDNRRTGFRPRPVDPSEFEGIRSELVGRSAEADRLAESLGTGADEVGAFLELELEAGAGAP